MRKSQPFFSIIVPTYNRPKQLAVCLQSLIDLEYPRDCFEVLVVDDGGKESLESVLVPFREQINLTLVKQTNTGPAAARNTGANNARGDILAFIDDDCKATENWLSILSEQFEESPDCIVGGKIVCDLSINTYAEASQMIIDIVYRHYNSDNKRAKFFSACNMAVPVEMFKKLGGFDPKFRISEDREFCDRCLLNSYQMMYLPEAVVYHDDYVRGFAGFFRRYFKYGRGAYMFHKIRSLRGSGSILTEMSFHRVLRNWLFFPFKHERFIRAFVMSFLLLVWQVSNASGFFYEAIRQKLKTND